MKPSTSTYVQLASLWGFSAVLLQAADVTTTAYGIYACGLYEQNPVSAMLINQSFLLFVFVKLIIGPVAFLSLFLFLRKFIDFQPWYRDLKISIVIVNLITLFAVLNNLYHIL